MVEVLAQAEPQVGRNLVLLHVHVEVVHALVEDDRGLVHRRHDAAHVADHVRVPGGDDPHTAIVNEVRSYTAAVSWVSHVRLAVVVEQNAPAEVITFRVPNGR